MKFDSGIVETLLEDDDQDEDAWKRKSVKVSTSLECMQGGGGRERGGGREVAGGRVILF